MERKKRSVSRIISPLLRKRSEFFFVCVKIDAKEKLTIRIPAKATKNQSRVKTAKKLAKTGMRCLGRVAKD